MSWDNSVINILKKENLNLPFNEYRDIDAFSSHFISGFASSSVRIFKEREKKGSIAFDIGSAIDCYLLDMKNFYNKFIITDTRLTGQLLELFKYIKETYYPVYLELPDNSKLLEISTELGLFNNVKDVNKILTKLEGDFRSEFERIPLYEGKIGITSDEELFIKQSARYLKENLNAELFSEDKFRINHFQLLRSMKYPDISGKTDEIRLLNIKGELDQLSVDFEEKLITITDIKSGEEPPDRFEFAFYKYKYWIQMWVYMDLVKDLMLQFHEFLGYEVRFRFIYISKLEGSFPVIYDVPNEWYQCAWEGWESKSGFKNVGIHDLITQMIWHLETGNFQHPKEVYDNDCHYTIKLPWK